MPKLRKAEHNVSYINCLRDQETPFQRRKSYYSRERCNGIKTEQKTKKRAELAALCLNCMQFRDGWGAKWFGFEVFAGLPSLACKFRFALIINFDQNSNQIKMSFPSLSLPSSSLFTSLTAFLVSRRCSKFCGSVNSTRQSHRQIRFSCARLLLLFLMSSVSEIIQIISSSREISIKLGFN